MSGKMMKQKKIIEFGPFRLDLDRKLLYKDHQLLEPERREYHLIRLLVENYPETLSHQQLFDALWPDQDISNAALTKLISRTRRLLGDDAHNPKLIKTVHGIGVRLLTPPQTQNQNEIGQSLKRVILFPVTNNSNTSEDDWVPLGLTELLAQQINGIKGVEHVDAGELLQNFRTDDLLDVAELKKQLAADIIIEVRLADSLIPRKLSYRMYMDEQWWPWQRAEGRDILSASSKLYLAMSRELQDDPLHLADLGQGLSGQEQTNRLYVRGLHSLKQGNFLIAEDYFRKALEHAPDFFSATVKLADSLYRQSKLDESSQLIDHLLDAKIDASIRLEAQHVLSNILYAKGKLMASLRVTRDCIQAAAEQGNRILEATEWMNQGGCLQSLGKLDEALESLSVALGKYEQLGDQRGVASVFFNIGNIYLSNNLFEKAYAQYDRAAVLFSETRQENHLAQTQFQMAVVSGSMDLPEQARQLLSDARKVFVESGDQEGLLLADIERNRLAIIEGRYPIAIERLEGLLEQCEKEQLHYPLFVARHYLARAWLNLHSPDKAETYLPSTEEFVAPEPGYLLLEAHVAYERKQFDQAVKLAKIIKKNYTLSWIEGHEKQLIQYKQSQLTGQWVAMKI